MQIKTLTGHLTATQKKHIKYLIDAKFITAKVNSINYALSENNGIYTVFIARKDRGMIPVPGSALRTTTTKATFTII